MELNLKNDIVFKAFFTKKGNERYLKSFLESLLEESIDEIEVVGEASLKQLTIANKMGRLDIKATINKTKIVNIEIQLCDNKDTKQRTELYGSRLISEQVGRGDGYQELKPVILINILNYNVLKVPEYATKSVTVAHKHRDYVITEDITYWFIELPKFRKSKPRLANALEGWLALIDDKDGRLSKMAEEKHEIIKEAKEEVEEILSEAVIKEINEFKQTAIWEENSRRHYIEEVALKKGLIEGRKKGLEKGMKEGLKKGKEEGMKQGIEKGTEKGIKEKTKKVVMNMLQKGMNIEDIVELVEITREEIEEVKKEM